MSRPIKVRDFRNKQFFMVDDEYMNGYARLLGPTASMIYICLCRHADKDQVAFPSQEAIAVKLGIKERTVLEKIKLLKKWKLVEVTQTKNETGKWVNNTYTLLDKTMWITKPDVEKQHTEPGVEKLQKPGVVLQHHKETHNKETHIKEYWIKKNPIINDPGFSRWVGGDLRGVDLLNERYPVIKYTEAWEQAKAYKKELS